MVVPEFVSYQKLPRLSRDIVITEKIDGTNAQVYVPKDPSEPLLAGSRNRWLLPGQSDNFGFRAWVEENADMLRRLGPGRHFGEWWGSGIQRGYGLVNGEKRFSLFNVHRFAENRPDCCGLVPVLYRGPFTQRAWEDALGQLQVFGSAVAPGFMRPEGIVIFHEASGQLFKKTIEDDEKPKGAK